MATRSKNDLVPELSFAYDMACTEFRLKHPDLPQPFMTCAIRTGAEQDLLFAQGRTKPGSKVTNATAGKSPHNFNKSFAFDIAFIGLNKELDWSIGLFKKFADIIKLHAPKGITCGIDFETLPDAPHFEVTGWKELAKDLKHV